MIERPRRGIGGVGRQVPFAQRHRVVAVLLQHFGDGAGALGDRPIASRIARRGLGDRRQPDLVMVSARQQGAARGRAQRGGVEIIVAQTFGGQLVEVGRMDRSAVGREMPVADVVQHDDDDVRRACWRRHRQGRAEIRNGVLVGRSDLAFELGCRHGKDFAVGASFLRMGSRRRKQADSEGQSRLRPFDQASVDEPMPATTSRRAEIPDAGDAIKSRIAMVISLPGAIFYLGADVSAAGGASLTTCGSG